MLLFERIYFVLRNYMRPFGIWEIFGIVTLEEMCKFRTLIMLAAAGAIYILIDLCHN